MLASPHSRMILFFAEIMDAGAVPHLLRMIEENPDNTELVAFHACTLVTGSRFASVLDILFLPG